MRSFAFELTASILLYGLSLFFASYLANHNVLGLYSGLWAALAPMPSTLLVGCVILRKFRLMDEMQRRIQTEAIVLAFAMTALFTFNYGFLEDAGFPRKSAFWVWPIMALFWIFAQFLFKKRYE